MRCFGQEQPFRPRAWECPEYDNPRNPYSECTKEAILRPLYVFFYVLVTILFLDSFFEIIPVQKPNERETEEASVEKLSCLIDILRWWHCLHVSNIFETAKFFQN